jgi:hypothetical protein
MWAPTSEPFSITQTETSRPPSASRSIVPSPWCGVAIRGAYISVEPI